ncbi:2-oxo acid dehydrogenase subunit E2 [Schlesneria paludicola]|uniref:2-oxo acid dehydrogenase subunit E2 n=1 Tax=Schlesneria paludicola TaxID=360056 RepID=UPI000299FAED|nr:2-oxo acid dehydrogenase subunit E2 [Schlesneria paludicola]
MPSGTQNNGSYYSTESQPRPLSDLGLMKCVYLSDNRAYRDPTIVWGTAVATQPMTDFLATESRNSNTLLSSAHVLICAVARSLAEHPGLNCKVIGRRVHPFKQINISMPLLAPVDKQVVPVLLQNVEAMSLRDIAQNLWNEARQRGAEAAAERRNEAARSPWKRFWTGVWREIKMQTVLRGTCLLFMINNQFRRPTRSYNAASNSVSALVNLLSFPSGAPPMQSFKPSTLPMNSAMLTVSMAAPEWRAVVVDGQVVARRVSPLFIKVDHRLAHIHEIAAFMNTLCRYLAEPNRLVRDNGEPATPISTLSAQSHRPAA